MRQESIRRTLISCKVPYRPRLAHLPLETKVYTSWHPTFKQSYSDSPFPFEVPVVNTNALCFLFTTKQMWSLMSADIFPNHNIAFPL